MKKITALTVHFGQLVAVTDKGDVITAKNPDELREKLNDKRK